MLLQTPQTQIFQFDVSDYQLRILNHEFAASWGPTEFELVTMRGWIINFHLRFLTFRFRGCSIPRL
jgi:hypothetical protein